MLKRIKYSLYKKSYSEFSAKDYNVADKTIEVELPEIKKPKFPKEWAKIGNRYRLPNGTWVYFWNSGLAENFYIERNVTAFFRLSRTIAAGINARQIAIETALEFDKEE